jgi:hypothetical protein
LLREGRRRRAGFGRGIAGSCFRKRIDGRLAALRRQQRRAAAELRLAVHQPHLKRLGLAAVAQHVGPQRERAQSGWPPEVEGEAAHRETGRNRQPLHLPRHQRGGGAALQHVRRPRPAGMSGGAKQLSLGDEDGGHRGLLE